MIRLAAVFISACVTSAFAAPPPSTTELSASVIIAVGEPGDDSYRDTFQKWGAAWQQAGKSARAKVTLIGATPADSTALTAFQKAIEAEPKDGAQPLWIALLGHGSLDAKEPKFNLTGDDLAASQLAEWLRPFRRPVIIVAGFSTSGAWLPPLSAKGRVIVTATKTGSESNYARFGGFFAVAIGDPSGDLDHDGQTSVLEAWLRASQQVNEFYESEGRLSTEHSLIEDTGDGLGTPPTFYQGIRAVKKPTGKAEVDGFRAHQLTLVPTGPDRALSAEQRQQRDAIEAELAELRATKSTLDEKEYFRRLEQILLRLARIYHPQ